MVDEDRPTGEMGTPWARNDRLLEGWALALLVGAVAAAVMALVVFVAVHGIGIG